MSMTLCRCCCFRFRFLSLSLAASLSLLPFRPFRHSPAIIFIFFGNILHFIRHSAACTFTLSLAASHPAWMCRPRRGHPARASPMRAGIGRLINAYIDGIRTYTHTHTVAHSFTRTSTHTCVMCLGGARCGSC